MSALRQAREVRLWSRDRAVREITDLAARKGLPRPGVDTTALARWERGRHLPDQFNASLLSELYQTSAAELGIEDVKRREFLQKTALSAITTGFDGARLVDALVRPARVDGRLLDSLAQLTRGFAHQAEEVPPAVLLPAVATHLARIRWLSAGSHPDSTRRRLQITASEAAVMAGRLAFWTDDRGQARSYYREARQQAREAGDSQLQAIALSFEADLYSGVPYLGTMGGDTETAYELFDEASSLERPDWSPLLRGWVRGCRAEELATLGRGDESDRDLEAAHTAMETARPGQYTAIDVANLDITTATAGLAGFEGACAIALGRTEQAERAFASGLAQAVSVGRYSGLAATYALKEEVEEGSRLLTLGLRLAVERDLATRLRRVEGIRARYFSRFESHPAVQRFDEELAAVR
jgi:transcriptional regulator with XRE-family HTH domain